MALIDIKIAMSLRIVNSGSGFTILVTLYGGYVLSAVDKGGMEAGIKVPRRGQSFFQRGGPSVDLTRP